MLSVTNRFRLRKAASRLLSTSPISLSTRTRSINTFTPVHLRLQTRQPAVAPLQRRWASEDLTQSEPSADRETDAQYGDNSIAASSETQDAEHHVTQESVESPSPAEDQSASLADSARSTAGAVADKVSDAASQVGAAAKSAVGAASSRDRLPEGSPKSVYVGNLFFDVKEHDLMKEFSKVGNVAEARVIHDHRGLSKG